MKATQFFIATLKEAPADAEVVSHKLLVRAGMIRQVARGIYDFLPLGLRAVRRVVIAVVGTTIVLVGVALLVLPGPAFIVIPIGLAVLALEFEWARRMLRRARELWKTPEPGNP